MARPRSGLHVSDDYHVTHVQGVWIAAAESARAGQLYPPLFDGEHYAGTRYMPLAILLNALAASLVDDPLIGGKLLAALLMATLLDSWWSSCAASRARGRWRLPPPPSWLRPDRPAGRHHHWRRPPAGRAAGRRARRRNRARSRPSDLIAGVLAGLAVASKLTGLWAFLGITTWLVTQQQWRPATTFAAAGIGAADDLLGTVEVVTGGGLSQHLLAFWLAGVHGGVSRVARPNQILFNLLGQPPEQSCCCPLACSAVLSRGWRQLLRRSRRARVLDSRYCSLCTRTSAPASTS